MRSTRLLVTALLVAVGVLSIPSVALASGGTSTSTTPPALSSVTLSVTDVTGGTPAVGTVTLTSKASTGGLVVALSSDNTAAATVPSSVAVAAGATTATFPVTTLPVGNPQSALIIGSAGGVTTYAIITVRTQSSFSTGTVAIIPGGNGSGTITSQPAGINCKLGAEVTGTCSAAYPVGTVVRLTATAAPGSKFQGWRGLPGCGDASKITVASTTIYCQPGFSLK
jgi:List-Bact-rpt repeat protein